MKKNKSLSKLQEVEVKQEDMNHYYNMIDKDSTDGDIFKIVRKVQLDANGQGFEVSNSLKVYNWFITYKDSL